jgi:ribonuclease E
VKRASNDPRMRRRQQREAQQSKVAAPKVQPSQIPTWPTIRWVAHSPCLW